MATLGLSLEGLPVKEMKAIFAHFRGDISRAKWHMRIANADIDLGKGIGGGLGSVGDAVGNNQVRANRQGRVMLRRGGGHRPETFARWTGRRWW